MEKNNLEDKRIKRPDYDAFKRDHRIAEHEQKKAIAEGKRLQSKKVD